MGIGKAVAVHYVNEGRHVGITDVNEDALNTFKREYDDKDAYCAVMDVTDKSRVSRAITDFAQTTQGKIDLFINNAGVGWGAHLLNCHWKAFSHCRCRCQRHADVRLPGFPYLKDAGGIL